MTTTIQAESIECRSIRSVELRAVKDGETRRIEGYAAVFNSPSEDLGWGTETIRPGAFTRALREKQDVRCLFNHDNNRVLGRSLSGTLTLAEDSKGLRFSCTLPDTQDARDVMTLIERGDISGCSFSFRAVRQEWVFPADGADQRILLDVDLYDVGPVTTPAYPATDVQVRSLRQARDAARAAAANDGGRPLGLAKRQAVVSGLD